MSKKKKKEKEEKPRRHEGWKVIEKKTLSDPSGIGVDRYVRVRTAGILKKLSEAFLDELEKLGRRMFAVGKGGAATSITAPKLARPASPARRREFRGGPAGTRVRDPLLTRKPGGIFASR